MMVWQFWFVFLNFEFDVISGDLQLAFYGMKYTATFVDLSKKHIKMKN